jgi:hypothetical protein
VEESDDERDEDMLLEGNDEDEELPSPGADEKTAFDELESKANPKESKDIELLESGTIPILNGKVEENNTVIQTKESIKEGAATTETPIIDETKQQVAKENEELATTKEDTNKEGEQQQKKEPQKPESNTYEKLGDLELLCRSCALNMLMKFATLSSIEAHSILASTNHLIQRLMQMIVWKSGLQSRMQSATASIYNMLSHPHRHRHIEVQNGSCGEKLVMDEEEEDYDQDEMFDDYGDVDIISMVTNSTDYQKLSSSQIFQKKCGYILSQFADHIRTCDKSQLTFAEDIKNQLRSLEKEFACLILYTNQYVSQHLVNCIFSEQEKTQEQ